MREILFRGKRDKKYDKEQGWVCGVPYIDNDGDCIMADDCSKRVVIPETVGQYTGVTDRNGKKIFEGDIVKGYSATGTLDFDKSVVLWSELFSQWQVEGSALFGSKICATYEVIGNIHDNPELLKEGAKQ